MTRFDDFLSTLLINITVARMKADYELTRVAQIYSEDPLLKHLPIPHMRLNNTIIKFPLAIEKISTSDTKLPSLSHIQNIVSESIKHAKSKDVKLNKYVKSLNSKIEKNYKNYTDHEKLLGGLYRDIDDTINDSDLKQINPQIKHALKKTILNLIDFSNLDIHISRNTRFVKRMQKHAIIPIQKYATFENDYLVNHLNFKKHLNYTTGANTQNPT